MSGSWGRGIVKAENERGKSVLVCTHPRISYSTERGIRDGSV